MSKVVLDETDVRILSIMQEDATLSIANIAVKANMSHNACWRRIKRLEETGVIAKRVTLLDASKLGLDITVFVSIRAAEHSEEWLKKLTDAVRDIPEVVEFYRMTGDIDYLLKLRVDNIGTYDTVYRRLIRAVRLTDVTSTFSMEEIKCTTALPLVRAGGR